MDNQPTLTIAQQDLITQLCALPKHTRDYVRKHIPERAYRKHFGTFAAFIQCAGLAANTVQKQHDKLIAKHAIATVAKGRLLGLGLGSNSGSSAATLCGHTTQPTCSSTNTTRAEYGYTINSNLQSPSTITPSTTQPNPPQIATVITGSDFHSTISDPFAVKVFISTVKLLQPDDIVLNGDILDCMDFSKHGTLDPRRYCLTDEFKWLDWFLSALRNAAPTAKITYLVGNHESRVLRHFANDAPYAQALLADVHGLTLADLLGITSHNVQFVTNLDLIAYKESPTKQPKDYIVLYDTLAIGHLPSIKKLQMPSIHGHAHQYRVDNAYSYAYGAYDHVQLGAMCLLDAAYCDAAHWSQGFVVTYIDKTNKTYQHNYIDTGKRHVNACGMWYSRKGATI